MGLRTSFESTDDGEQYVTVTEREKGVWAAVAGTQTIATTTWHGLIDLSDTTNWPHDATGRLDFSFLRLSVDKDAAARGSFSIGIITRIDNVSADVVFFGNVNFTENDTPSLELDINISPMQIKTIIQNERLRQFKTNAVSLAVTAVNTALTLPPYNFTPAVGDCVLRLVTTTGGNLTFVAAANYHAHP